MHFCGEAQDVVADVLAGVHHIHKRFIQSFDDVMHSDKYIGNDILGFSTKMYVVGSIFATFILEDSLEEITT